MKKSILILVFFALFSCRNDSDSQETNSTETNIIGKWSFLKVDVIKSSTNQTQTTENSDCDKKSIHEFQETIHKSTFYGIINNTCQPTGEVNSRNYSFDKVNMKFWYENEQDYPYYVTKLTTNELVFEDRTQDIDNDNKKDIIRRYFKKIQ